MIDFIVPGSAKAGTTTIYNYLKRHPAVCIPRKETFYFISDLYQDNSSEMISQWRIVRSQKKYESYYESCDTMSGEVATGYLYHHEHVIPKLKSFLNDSFKVLIVLRNPVYRAFSNYSHMVRDGYDERTFESAFFDNLKEENPNFMMNYYRMGLYHEAVKAYKDNFDTHVVFFEDLESNPEIFFKDICKFLDIEFLPVSGPVKSNPSSIKENSIFYLLLKQIRGGKYRFLRKFLPDEKRRNIRQFLLRKSEGEKKTITDETYQKCIKYYAEDISKLEKLLGSPIKQWNYE